MFLYEISGGEVRILACESQDTVIHIPETIEGYPVTELGPYAFSQGRGRRKELADRGIDVLEEKLCGTGLEELYLPKSLKKVGNYGFYNCFAFRYLHCFSAMEDLGSGLFTGCTGIQEIEIHMVDGKKSCFKEMLSELRQELWVTYKSGEGTARLVFPEMYEESVENTPARIIMREMHGCGHKYRYCFDETRFQFQRYDALFPHICVNEPERVSVLLALWRLQYPLELWEGDREIYEAYVREHLSTGAVWFLERQDGNGLIWLTEHYADSAQAVDSLIELADSMKVTEGISYLMDFRHRNHGVRKKRFVL